MQNTNPPTEPGFRTRLRPLLVALITGVLSSPALAATLTVNSNADTTADDGFCTLREAITAANTDTASGATPGECIAGSGTDTLAFNIGAGPQTLSPAAALPTITSTVHIDGYTQPGASANTLAVGNDAVINIRLDGAGAGAGVMGLWFVTGSNGSSVRGLAITGFDGSGIVLDGGGALPGTSGYSIAGNFIGTNSAGADLGNNGAGIFVYDIVGNSTIGGAAAADRNVIAGSGNTGITLGNSGTTGNTVRNNYIGVAPDGLTPLPDNQEGIRINGADHTTIHGNVISGTSAGIGIFNIGSDHTTITGNLIGVGADGSADIGVGNYGIQIFSGGSGIPNFTVIGGTAPGNGNRIANWGGDGIRIDRNNPAHPYSTGNSISGNAIHDNAGLGINLIDSASGSGAGVNANDAGDADNGANQYQNYPVASAATTNGVNTTVNFTLNGTPVSDFRIEFFSSPSCDASGNGEGRVFLGSAAYTTDAGGNLSATIPSLPATTVGHFITMTATEDMLESTSEFSVCRAVAAASVATPVQSIPVMSEAGLALTSLLLALAGGLSRRFRGTRR